MSSFFGGTPGGFESVSTLTRPQRKVHKNLISAAQGEGASGAFGTAADYYRDLLSDNPADLEAFAAPEERRFREQILPGVQEQFAGMGSGGLSSSGYRNASINASTDLAERIGAIRAGLRQSGAQGLQNIGQQALNPVKENVYMQGQPGFAEQALPALMTGAATAFGGPLAGAAVSGGTNWLNSFGAPKVGGGSLPYGGGGSGIQSSSRASLPSFNSGMRR